MCTVSFFNTGNSLIFTSSRDEKKDRENAVFPEILALENNVLYFPKDKKADGTWFVADENGNVTILLNGAFQKHENRSSYRKSRGIILLDLAKSKNILYEFRKYDLLEIEPFQLLVFSQKKLLRLLWDGNDKHEIALNKDKNHLLSSKTLYNDEIVNERQNIFEKFQKKENTDADEILKFHKNHQIEKEPNIERIIKEKFVTVSITQLIVTNQDIEFSTMIWLQIQNKSRKLEKELWSKLKYKWHRITHWEYWPMWAIYFPCIFYYFWISLKSRSFGFFKAVNPAIPHGGMTLENKNFVNQLIPQKFRAKSFFIHEKSDLKDILNIINENELKYPLILKPNSGCRGRNVELVQNRKQLENYLQKFDNEDLLLEEYIDFSHEIGVFYIRLPNNKTGFISGIVEKKGVEVCGDGKQNLGELVKYNFRYHNFYPSIFLNKGFDENYIPKANEKILLSSIGNHARGATFFDSSHKISNRLEEVFNKICSHIEGFYYGRFDVKFTSWEELENSENFKIIELNGAASEPTFIYDPKNSYFSAVKEITRHWDYMYQIAKINKEKGHHFTKIDECWTLFKEFNPFSVNS